MSESRKERLCRIYGELCEHGEYVDRDCARCLRTALTASQERVNRLEDSLAAMAVKMNTPCQNYAVPYSTQKGISNCVKPASPSAEPCLYEGCTAHRPAHPGKEKP